MKLKSYMDLKDWMEKNTPLTSTGIYEVLDKIQEIEAKEKAESIRSPLEILIALADRAIAQLETMSLHQALDNITELRNQLRAGA